MGIFLYEDIVNLPHPVSKTRKRMSMHDRAGQFAPFAALTGYDGQVREAGRLTQMKVELDETELAILNQQYQILSETKNPEVKVVYFVPDKYKEGGEYVTFEGTVKRVNGQTQTLEFTDKTSIPMADIFSMESACFALLK